MIQITINGRKLDVYDEQFTITNKSFRFSSVIPDKYTTDIDIPATDNNLSILGIHTPDDREQLFARYIYCGVSIFDNPSDGYLQVMSITDNLITVTLYIPIINYDILDKKIREVVPDTSETLYDWFALTPSETDATKRYGIFNYNGGFDEINTNNKYFNRHPSIAVNTAIQKINQALNLSIETLDDYQSLFLLTNTQHASPYIDTQYIFAHTDSDTATDMLKFEGTIHPTNNVPSIKDDATDYIEFDRDCEVYLDFYCRRYRSSVTDYSHGISTALYRNGNAIAALCPQNYPSTFNVTHSPTMHLYFQKGERLTCSYYGCFALIKITYVTSSYSITETDFGKPFKYHPLPVSLERGYDCNTYWYLPNTTAYTSPSYNKLGIFANFSEMTVRDFLTSLCWYTLKKLKVNGKSLLFKSSNANESIKATITKKSPITSTLAKTNTIRYKGDNPREIFFNITNDFLDGDKTIHESSFTSFNENNVIHQYTQEAYEENSTTLFRYNAKEINPTLCIKDNVTLIKSDKLKYQYTDTISKIVLITAETYDDISEADFVTIEGHTYMLIQTDTNSDTLKTTFTALLMEGRSADESNRHITLHPVTAEQLIDYVNEESLNPIPPYQEKDYIEPVEPIETDVDERRSVMYVKDSSGENTILTPDEILRKIDDGQYEPFEIMIGEEFYPNDGLIYHSYFIALTDVIVIGYPIIYTIDIDGTPHNIFHRYNPAPIPTPVIIN